MTTLDATPTWEKLLSLASVEAQPASRQHSRKPFDPVLLRQAYAHCSSMTSLHSRSFFIASSLLPAEKRRAARALYAFCRTSDDIVDTPGEDPHRALVDWQEQALRAEPSPTNPVAVAWADTRMRYNIPAAYAEQLLAGVARDLYQTRYQTFEDLAAYCYSVASTVGLMSMHIIGFCSPDARPYAIKLGVALQLTNILRDVGEDWHKGRVYLPQEELAGFGLSEDDLAAGRVSDRWRSFMRFQITRAQKLYVEAQPGIQLLDRDGRFAAAAASTIYSGILDDIERHDYDVFSRRAHVRALGKLGQLTRAWRAAGG